MERCTYFLYVYKFKEQIYVIMSHFSLTILPLGFFFFFFFWEGGVTFENYNFILIFNTQFFFLNVLYALGFFFTSKIFVWIPNSNPDISVKPYLIQNFEYLNNNIYFKFSYIFEILFWHALSSAMACSLFSSFSFFSPWPPLLYFVLIKVRAYLFNDFLQFLKQF